MLNSLLIFLNYKIDILAAILMMKTLFFLISINFYSFSQNININDLILKNMDKKHPMVHHHQRSIMQPKKNYIQIINPLNYISIALMFTYQRAITQQLNGSCVFENSCSQFTKKAINYHGLIVGSLIGLNQLQTCFPSSFLDYPDHKLNNSFKIKNPIPTLNED